MKKNGPYSSTCETYLTAWNHEEIKSRLPRIADENQLKQGYHRIEMLN